ncbi:hypothetical protein ACVWXU_007819 [Streptomyces sp. TE33382]
MIDDPGRAEHGAALAAEGLGEGERGHDALAARESGGGERAAPSFPEHPETVRVVDEQCGALGPTHLGQRGQRGRVTVDREDRVGHGERPPAVRAQHLAHRFGVRVRDDGGLGPGEPAAVHDRGMVARVGDDQRALGGQGGEGREVGGVAGGEHEGRLEAAEARQFVFEFGVQFGGAGDQP